MADAAVTSREAIETSQLDQLRRLIGQLVPGNRFYAPRLQTAGLDGNLASLEHFTASMPPTTKAELAADQTDHPPYGTNLTYPLDGYCRFHQTSGTTSQPLRWLDTAESWQWMLESWKQVYRAAGVDAGDRVFFAFSFGPFLGFWTAFEAAVQLGCLALPGGGLGSEARLQIILDNNATVLCCTPTYALRLAEVARETGVDLSDSTVRLIIVAGEPGGSVPATRRRISESWHGARVFDHHGMTEVGPVTYECPQQPGTLHVIETAYLAEVIHRGDGRPAGNGEEGELVLTTLGRVGSPLLRYRTGDLVRPVLRKTACACGSFDLALEGGILGRTDDMVVVRGVNIYPGAVDQVIRDIGQVGEYRVHVDTSATLPQID
ncbi:MAG: AMP-binding protein, partial [Phycisphaerae bacterium]|nr:AMP-binding protein [Phycisphaerae bacterium]